MCIYLILRNNDLLKLIWILIDGENNEKLFYVINVINIRCDI